MISHFTTLALELSHQTGSRNMCRCMYKLLSVISLRTPQHFLDVLLVSLVLCGVIWNELVRFAIILGSCNNLCASIGINPRPNFCCVCVCEIIWAATLSTIGLYFFCGLPHPCSYIKQFLTRQLVSLQHKFYFWTSPNVVAKHVYQMVIWLEKITKPHGGVEIVYA